MSLDPIATAATTLPSEAGPHALGGRLSARMVGQLAVGEQFVVWALRQRLRDAAPASAVLVHGFRLAFGLGDLEPALAAFEGCFRILATRAAVGGGGVALCPLRCACLTADEEAILGLVAGAGPGRPDQPGERLVEVQARAALRAHAASLGAALARSNLYLPAPASGGGGSARVH